MLKETFSVIFKHREVVILSKAVRGRPQAGRAKRLKFFFLSCWLNYSDVVMFLSSAIEAQIQELFLRDEEQRSKEEEAQSSEEQEETSIVKRKRRRRKRPYNNRHPHGSDIRYSTTFGSKLRGHSV